MFHFKAVLLFGFICLTSQTLAGNVSFIDDNEKALKTKLFSDYDKSLKPKGRIDVDVEFALFQVNDLMEKNQIISVEIWVNQVWYDRRLTWNPADYGNLTQIFVYSDKFWV